MNSYRQAVTTLGVLLFTLGVAMAELATIEGTAFYRERIALQPGAVLEVQLLDTSLADAPSETLASLRIKVERQVPVPFQLHYDPSMIEPHRTYCVTAKLIRDGEVIFRSDTHHPVLTRGAGSEVDVLMVRSETRSGTTGPEGSREESMESQAELVGPVWVAEDIDSSGVIDRLQSHITFTAEGLVRGSGGCNNFSGDYKVDAEQLSFGPLATTMMACPEAIMDQETRFHRALARARTFRIENGLLFLLDEEGTALMRLWKRD